MNISPADALLILEQCNWNTDWVPPHTRVVETAEFCALVSPVVSARFNSVLRCLETGSALSARIEQINTLYADRSARFHLYPHRPGAALQRQLQAIGFAPDAEYDARVIETQEVSPPSRVHGVHFKAVMSADTLRDADRVITRVFDGARQPPTDEERQHQLGEIRAHRMCQLVGYDERSGHPVAQGGVAFYPELGIGLLFGGSTVESHRGRGIYRALIKARAEICRRKGLSMMGLWAQKETSSPITARQGFTNCGTMARWTRPRPPVTHAHPQDSSSC